MAALAISAQPGRRGPALLATQTAVIGVSYASLRLGQEPTEGSEGLLRHTLAAWAFEV